MNSSKNLQQGYVTLVIVLIIVSISSLIIFIAVESGVISSRSISVSEIGAQALYNAEICGEEALERLRQDSNYNTDFTMTLTVGTCEAEYSGSGNNITIDTTGVVGNSTRKLSISTIDLSPLILLNEWQES